MTDYQKTMEEIVENGIAQGHIIGANVLMIKDDKEVYFKSHGYADKENGVPMKRDAIFRLYSMTKPVTAAATMILAERGKIDLWDPESGFYFTTKIADGATKQNILDTFTSINGKIHYGQQGASETQNAYEGYMTQSGKYTIYKIDEKLFNMFGYTNKTDYLQGMSLSVEEKKDSDGKYYLAITAPNGTTKNVYYNASNKRYEFGNGSTTYIPVNFPYVSTDSRSMDIPSFYYVNYDLVSEKVYNTSYYAGNLKTKPIVPITPSDPTNPTIPDDPILANGAEELTVWIQSGCEAGQGMFLKIDRMDTTILGINDLDVSTVSGANHALDAVKGALEKVSSNRSKIGAQQNRLEHTIANELNVVENTTSAESRIRDTDMSKEMVAFSKDMILENVGQAMLAQANQSNQGVLSLLQ